MNNQFSENLKKIRKENNLSQEQLADELGVSRQAISKWESAVAYPEMDKIIALCDKFNLNIDDLLHKDIKEVKKEEESNRKINNVIESFLGFVTDTVNLICSMSFKNRIKCFFEQAVIVMMLFIASTLIYYCLGNLFNHLINFLPYKIYNFIYGILGSLITISLLIISIIIITHVFKTRYLNYYKEMKKKMVVKESDDENENIIENNTYEDKDTNKIIIRDPKHSEYKFINALFKLIIIAIKFFALWLGLFVAFALICLCGAFIASFMLHKTGLFFIGLLVTILSASVIALIILLLILNFVFNRTNNKKHMILTFLTSLVTFGVGCGLIFVGTLSFDVIKNEKAFKKITKEYDMNENLILDLDSNNEIEYVDSDNGNIKIEYTVSKYCTVEDKYKSAENTKIEAWSSCENPTKTFRKIVDDLNDKKIYIINTQIEKATIYTNKSNINKLKNNRENYFN